MCYSFLQTDKTWSVQEKIMKLKDSFIVLPAKYTKLPGKDRCKVEIRKAPHALLFHEDPSKTCGTHYPCTCTKTHEL